MATLLARLPKAIYWTLILENPSLKSQPVKHITTAPFPFVELNTSIDKITGLINKENIAVLVTDEQRQAGDHYAVRYY
jgi:predicted transcriptional regulator